MRYPSSEMKTGGTEIKSLSKHAGDKWESLACTRHFWHSHVSSVHSFNTNKFSGDYKNFDPIFFLPLLSKEQQEARHAHGLTQHRGSGPFLIPSSGSSPCDPARLPRAHSACLAPADSEEQQIVAAGSTEHSPRWTSTGLLRAQNKSLVPTPLKLWGIWNLDPDLKLVAGLPSPGSQLGDRFINTSATASFSAMNQ